MSHPAVLESTVPEIDVQRPSAGPAPDSRHNYTTEQEIAWLDDLAHCHKWRTLQLLQAIYPLRSWACAGMAVDGDRVQGHIAMLLRRAPR